MSEQRQFICVTCPVGCAIDAVVDGETVVEMRGYACKRGVEFVHKELTAPRRMLTTTVRVQEGVLPLAPVRSAGPLPKGLIADVVDALRRVILTAPVREHQVILKDALGSGVDVIASRDLPRRDGAN